MGDVIILVQDEILVYNCCDQNINTALGGGKLNSGALWQYSINTIKEAF